MFLEESLLVIGYISISKSMQCCIEVWELPMLGAKFEHSIPNPGSFKSGIISFHNYSSNRGKEIRTEKLFLHESSSVMMSW